MKPTFYTVGRRIRETDDVVTLDIPFNESAEGPAVFKPGQFNMLYAFGVGEAAISISGDPAAPDRMIHTIRSVGPVSHALTQLRRGDQVGLRGPFGSRWPVDRAVGKDLLIIAGGLGLAPLRPALYHLLNQRADYGRAGLLIGARSPADLPFRQEIDRWRREPGLQVRVTVDRAGADWPGDVGLVTDQLAKVKVDPLETVAMICGPEIMIRMTGLALQDMGIDPDRIFVSLERSMKCATGHCGHCQFGPYFVCRDGPVFGLDTVGPLMNIREL